jgi:hypothetical protein
MQRAFSLGIHSAFEGSGASEESATSCFAEFYRCFRERTFLRCATNRFLGGTK